MSRYLIIQIGCTVLLNLAIITDTALGNVYVSGLQPEGEMGVSYVLNENATSGITISVQDTDGGEEVYSSGLLTDSAYTFRGQHTWQWDGTGSVSGNSYKFVITAYAVGYAEWTQNSNDANTTSMYYFPRGVAVNRNTDSANFGRIYVAEGLGGETDAGRTTNDGLYVMLADQSDAIGQGDVARDGGIDWSLSSLSPFKITIAPDDNVFISDWSDIHSGVWLADSDASGTFSELLDNTGRQQNGLVAGLHGSVSGIWVEGIGHSRVMYTLDEDLDLGGSPGSVLWYNIGIATSGYNTPPNEETSDISDYIINGRADLVHDEDGSWWIAQSRYTESETAPSLTRFEPGGTAPVYNSAADPCVTLNKTYGSIDIHNEFNRLAMGTTDGVGVYILDINDPNNLSLVTTIPQFGYTHDIAFDAAGNIYIVNSWTETLGIWSPPGQNSFTTESWFTITIEPRLMITEVVDGDLLGGKPKWIEITNCGDESIELVNYRILVYFNGSTSYDFYTSYGDMINVLAPGESFVIANDNCDWPDNEFLDVYGYEADLYHPAINGNGNDVYELVRNEDGDHSVDIYGRIGESGSADYSMDWAYQDSYAYRLPNSKPKTTFDVNDWFAGGNGALGEPNDPLRIQALLDNTTPSIHTCYYNDECVDAIEIYYGITYFGSTVGATGIDESSCTSDDAIDVWHWLVPFTTGRYMISLEGSLYDTSLAVYDLCNGNELACNDDYYSLQSRVIVKLTEKRIYYVRVSGCYGNTGEYALNFTLAADISKNGIVDFEDLRLLCCDWLQSGPGDADIAPDNYSNYNGGDMSVDFIDFTALAQDWNAQQPAE